MSAKSDSQLFHQPSPGRRNCHWSISHCQYHLSNMQSRNAAFTVLRRLALQDVGSAPRTSSRWGKPTSRLLQYSTTRPLRSANLPQGDPLYTVAATKTQIPRPKVQTQRKVYDPAAAYEMTFTCKPCSTRSSHRVSKQGYHYGSVLISCPECKNRHVISDHLGVSLQKSFFLGQHFDESVLQIFTDKAMTIEDLMRERGQLVKKGTLSEDGDVEFWEDGTSTTREKDGGGS